MTNSINQTATVMVFNNSEFGNIRISLSTAKASRFSAARMCARFWGITEPQML